MRSSSAGSAGVGVAFLPRHGRGHRILPSEINFRANICALKQLGAELLLAVGAVGSLREEHRARATSSFPTSSSTARAAAVEHVLRRRRRRARRLRRSGLSGAVASSWSRPRARPAPTVHEGGTYVCMEGPQFSTRAESQLLPQLGRADVIGMTNLQEAKLAREAEICFATLALVTDYDCWNADAERRGHRRGAAHSRTRTRELRAARSSRASSPQLPAERACGCAAALAHAIITDRARIPASARARPARRSPVRYLRSDAEPPGEVGTKHSKIGRGRLGGVRHVETPTARWRTCSAARRPIFSVAASFFAPVAMVGVVGDRLPEGASSRFLRSRGIDTRGDRDRRGTHVPLDRPLPRGHERPRHAGPQLNVFAEFQPKLPEAYRAAEICFLANIHPSLQQSVLRQLDRPELVGADTMTTGSTRHRAATSRRCSAASKLLIINDEEARLLSGERNIVARGAEDPRDGADRACSSSAASTACCSSPATRSSPCPRFRWKRSSIRPGAGDAFAGGFIGALRRVRRSLAVGRAPRDRLRQRHGLVRGRGLRLERLRKLTREDVERRYRQFVSADRVPAVNPVGALRRRSRLQRGRQRRGARRRRRCVPAIHSAREYEIVFVDDGSDDGTFDAPRAAQDAAIPRLRVDALPAQLRSDGGAAAGIDHARGDDRRHHGRRRQNDPADIPRLLAGARGGLRPGRRLAARSQGRAGSPGACRARWPTG